MKFTHVQVERHVRWSKVCLPTSVHVPAPLPPRTHRICRKSEFWAKLKAPRRVSIPPTPIFFSKILFNLLEHIFGRFSNLTTFETFHMDIAHIYRGISGQKQWCTRTCIVEYYFCHFSSLWVIPRLPQYMPCFCRKSSHPNIHTYMYIMLSRKKAACIACYSRASASGVPICPFQILPRASYLSSQLFLSTTLAHNLGGGRPPLPSETFTRNVQFQP